MKECFIMVTEKLQEGECLIDTHTMITDVASLRDAIITSLEDDKAEDIVLVDLKGKTSFADMMVIADGRSNRHVSSMADSLMKTLKHSGVDYLSVEGLESCDWVLIDAGDIVVHLFKPTIRELYNLEKMWAVAIPEAQPLMV
jgi:ribosome-associated protein